MKKIVCELCGESDFVKVNGFFECQVCGAKYTIEEARTMFVEVGDDTKKPAEQTTVEQVEEAQKSPTIVKRVVVKAKTPSNDSQNVKRIVANVKTGQQQREGVKPQVKPTGGVQPVVKKVVVKPTPKVTTVKKVVAQPQVVEPKQGMSLEKNQMIENFFILSQNAFDSKNYTDAENYANRVIEIDPKNCDAWLMKGNCAGWQTTTPNFRFLESINCWNTCLQNSDKYEFDNYQFTVRTNTIDVAIAYVLRNIIDIKKDPNEKSLDKVKEAVDYLDPLMRKANETYGVDIISYEDKLASNISAIVTDISKQATAAFGRKKEAQTDEAYDNFVKTQDVCISIWSYLIDLAKKHGTVTAILNNIVKMESVIIKAVSYKGTGTKIKESKKITLSDKNQRLEFVKKCKRRLEDKFVDIRKRDRVEQKLKNAKYWEEHQEEKEELLQERAKLDHEVFELENSKLKMPELTELKKLEEEAIRLQVLKNNPTYSSKERNAYLEEWNKTKKLVVTKKRELASRLNPIEDKIEKLKRRILTIDVELNQNR